MGLELKEIVEGMSGKRVRQILNENMQATVEAAEAAAEAATEEVSAEVEELKRKVGMFMGTINTAEEAGPFGTYYVMGSVGNPSGLLTCGKTMGFNEDAQIMQSTSTPVFNEDGSIHSWNPKPCTIIRKKIGGSWSTWEVAGEEKVNELAGNVSQLVLKIGEINNTLYGTSDDVEGDEPTQPSLPSQPQEKVSMIKKVPFETGFYYKVNEGLGNITAYAKNTLAVADTYKAEIKKGDAIYLRANWSTTQPMWAFVDKETNVIIAQGDPSKHTSRPSSPVEEYAIAPKDCIVVISCYNAAGDPSYGNTLKTPYCCLLFEGFEDGVFDAFVANKKCALKTNDGTISLNNAYVSFFASIKSATEITVEANDAHNSYYAFITNEIPVANRQSYNYATGESYRKVDKGTSLTFDVPQDAATFYMPFVQDGQYEPNAITIKYIITDNVTEPDTPQTDPTTKKDGLVARVEAIENIITNGGGTGSGSDAPTSKGETSDVPTELGVMYAIKKAYDLANISVYARSAMSFGGNNIASRNYFVGMPYSSTRVDNTFVPNYVTIETFISALTNPNSYAYTKNPGFGASGNIYYGTVCGMFVCYCLGMKTCYHRNMELFEADGFAVKQNQSANGANLGDVINDAKSAIHTMLIVGIDRKDGIVTHVTTADSWQPYVRITRRTAAEFNSMLNTYTLLSYNKYYKNTYDGSVGRTYVINKHIMPRKGNRSNWGETEAVTIDILDASTFTKYELCKNGNVVSTTPISGNVISLGQMSYGKYELRLTDDNGNKSLPVEWIVVNCTLSAQAIGNETIRINFASKNARPYNIVWAREDYMNLCTFDATEKDIDNGYKDTELSKTATIVSGLAGYPQSKYEQYKTEYITNKTPIYPRILLETEFGVWTSPKSFHVTIS